ncbi:alr5224 [Nostoc sp. PCC 7120 = FACHB-418]|nr:alr5224 [Nostoc sp. PCC 7120 = FACHB-418]
MELQRRCDRNRKRSKRRAIYCPIHGCYLDSVSQKYRIFADQAGQLQQRGMSRRNALMLVANQTTVAIEGEWLEAFWCEECQETKWYHVCKSGDRTYEISLAPREIWQQVTGVIDSQGNPSISEFTRRSARDVNYQGLAGFQFLS